MTMKITVYTRSVSSSAAGTSPGAFAHPFLSALAIRRIDTTALADVERTVRAHLHSEVFVFDKLPLLLRLL